MLPYELHTLIVLGFCAVLTISSRHVVRIPQGVRNQGYRKDFFDLGEVVGEQVVDSKAACGRLCGENDACYSVMLVGQLCRMYAAQMLKCPCFTSISPDFPSVYKVFKAEVVMSFADAQGACMASGGHLVHINSELERTTIASFLTQSGDNCHTVFTGGWSTKPGSPQSSDWRWLHTTNPDGPFDPVTYTMTWIGNEPNGAPWNERGLGIKKPDYTYTDMQPNVGAGQCYMCECQ